MITDVNVNLFRWPFRRLPHDEPDKLVRKLRERGITQAWAGSFDGLLHKDLAAVNRRTAEVCRQFGDGLLLPVGEVNLSLPNWQSDILDCRRTHDIRVLRIHPNYHGYDLSHPAFPELLKMSADEGLVLQIVLQMEDERTQHPLLQVPTLKTAGLAELLSQQPTAKVVLLNGMKSLRGAALTELIRAGQVFVEVSMLEGVGGIERLCDVIPVERILFGSHFPFFLLESAVLKLQESDLGSHRLAAITHQNAARLLLN